MLNRVKILVVDDDPYLLDLLTETLDALEYEPIGAPSAEVALDRLKKSDFDLIITDIKMPGMDGIEFTRLVKREYPHLPVIFITGVYSDDLKEELVQGVLAKPFRINQVEEMIENTIGELPPAKNDRHVLVVDDDDTFRMMLVETLKISDYTVEAAADAEEALQKIREGNISTVITDIKMPGRDGLSLTRSIKKHWPEIMVILITGFVPYEDSPDFIDIADGILIKPFKVENITELLKDLHSRAV